MSSSRVLEVTDLAVDYRVGRRTVRAVSGVALTIDHGKTLGLVGESGSGKTTIGRAILGLAPTAAGRIVFNGQDLTGATPRQRHRTAGRIRAVFQDPYSSLNPALSIAASLLEALPDRRQLRRADARRHLDGLLEQVGLDPAIATRYPGRLSGGQRQRVAIARALVSSPELIICDEPVSALDVSIQAQILNLLRDVQRDTGVSYLFIGHDLDVVRYMSDHVAVLYRGQLMETGPVEVVTRHPRHPYTQTLVAATPTLHPDPIGMRRIGTTDAQPTRSEGCKYADHCPMVVDTCRTLRPTPQQAADGGHVFCHRYPDVA
ncbi:ABC transporter ATP-binding protein [Streptomyces sp. cg40]|uniref:ABC transporter ATP-binding protein n=1 Tax=Streptomyces sp. cg40 TaxID=3419764 RepID=UPI003D02181D